MQLNLQQLALLILVELGKVVKSQKQRGTKFEKQTLKGFLKMLKHRAAK